MPKTLLLALLFLPQLLLAGAPPATTVDQLVAQLDARLDQVVGDYNLDPGEVPDFDDPRFNRLIGMARICIDRAQTNLDAGRTPQALRWIQYSVRFLDAATRRAISINISGSGFPDDLASFTRFAVERFNEDLITLCQAEFGTHPWFLLAVALQAEGDALQQSDIGNWSPSVRHYVISSTLLLHLHR